MNDEKATENRHLSGTKKVYRPSVSFLLTSIHCWWEFTADKNPTVELFKAKMKKF